MNRQLVRPAARSRGNRLTKYGFVMMAPLALSGCAEQANFVIGKTVGSVPHSGDVVLALVAFIQGAGAFLVSLYLMLADVLRFFKLADWPSTDIYQSGHGLLYDLPWFLGLCLLIYSPFGFLRLQRWRSTRKHRL